MTATGETGARRKGRARTALIAGMFDMQNFGDLLFPIVARHRLQAYGINVAAVSPTAASTGLRDALPTIAISDAFRAEHAADAVIIGGGYIVHGHRMDTVRAYRVADYGAWAGPSIWLGATLVAAARDIPVAWNAPGAPHPLPRRLQALASAACGAADYLSVRDYGSLRILPEPEGGGAKIVPDPIADLARVWPQDALQEAFGRVVERLGIESPERLAAIHVRRRSLAGMSTLDLAALIDQFAMRTGLCPVLIGVGSAHGDDTFARTLGNKLTVPAAVLDAPHDLREVAATIAFAQLYVGSSLHGYIAAAAYGVKGILVGRPAYHKFKGFLDHTGRTQDLAADWREALENPERHATGEGRAAIPSSVFAALDQHWEQIAKTVHAGGERRRRERLNFLALAMAQGVIEGGPGWPFVPFCQAKDRRAALSGEDVRNREPI